MCKYNFAKKIFQHSFVIFIVDVEVVDSENFFASCMGRTDVPFARPAKYAKKWDEKKVYTRGQ